jgi:hypothetical protein
MQKDTFYALRMAASDGAITYHYYEGAPKNIKSGKQYITLFTNLYDAEVLKDYKNRCELEMYDIVKVILQPDGSVEIYDTKY